MPAHEFIANQVPDFSSNYNVETEGNQLKKKVIVVKREDWGRMQFESELQLLRLDYKDL
jgi:hypothetical protein